MLARFMSGAGARSAIAKPLVRISSFISNYLDPYGIKASLRRLKKVRLSGYVRPYKRRAR